MDKKAMIEAALDNAFQAKIAAAFNILSTEYYRADSLEASTQAAERFSIAVSRAIELYNIARTAAESVLKK